VAESGRPGYQDVLRDLFATGMSAYPAAVNAMLGYWSEMLANASSYYTGSCRVNHAGSGEPASSYPGARLKQHLERSVKSGARSSSSASDWETMP
jgi:hypothetical protein